MPTLGQIIPDVEILLAMEPEQLAGHLLAVMNSDGSGRMYTLSHWMGDLLGGGNPTYPSQYQDRVFRAVAEAWGWLEAQGLLVWPDLGNGRNGYRTPSRRGAKLATAEAFGQFLRSTTLPKEFLHPRLQEKVWLIFLGGDYDTAVFQAFKEVEVAVRKAAGLPETTIGVTLMRKAFDPASGPLTDRMAPPAEREALASLFAGAIGYYKNPQSHKEVGLTDAAEAREMITLANHLLRIVDARLGH